MMLVNVWGKASLGPNKRELAFIKRTITAIFHESCLLCPNFPHKDLN